MSIYYVKLLKYVNMSRTMSTRVNKRYELRICINHSTPNCLTKGTRK